MAHPRIGYVGCGFMAQRVHLRNLRDLAGRCELAAIAELRPRLRERVCDAFGVAKRYTDHHELAADPDIDAVGISGHHAVQGEIAIAMLRAGKHVFVEKPLAISTAQGQRIVAAERASGKRVLVGYMKRYDAGNRLLRAQVRTLRGGDGLGDITFLRNHGFCGAWDAGADGGWIRTDEPHPPAPAEQPFPDWLPTAYRQSYLGYIQQYTHNVNLMRWLLDAGGDWEVLHTHLDDQGTGGIAVLRIGGVRCSLESGQVDYHAWDEHTQIWFDRGWLRSEAPPLLLRNVCATVQRYDGRKGQRSLSELTPDDGWTWSYREEMRAFLDLVEHGAEPESPAADTLQDVRLLEAIYRHHCERIGVVPLQEA